MPSQINSTAPKRTQPRRHTSHAKRNRPHKFYVSTPFIIVLLGCTALTAYLVRPFWSALFLSATLAVACYPLQLKLTQLLGGRQRLSGFILVASLLAFIIAPLASMITVVVRELTQGLQWMQDSLGIDSLQELSVGHLPAQIQHGLRQTLAFLHIGAEDLHGYAGRALGLVQHAAPGVVSTSFNAVGATLFVLAAFYFLTVDGKQIVDFLVRVSPLQKAQTDELFDEFRRTSSAALLGSVITSAIVGAVVTVGFIAVGVPHSIFFGIATLVAGFIPVIGSAIIWVPAVLVLAASNRLGASVGLAIWCAVGVFVADNVVKPMMMRGKSEMHVGLVFLSLLGGLAMFGGIGIIAGPVLMAFFLAMLRIYARDYVLLGKDEAALTPTESPPSL